MWNVFPLVYVFFNFFQQYFVVFMYKSFVFLVKFIPKYFILFDAIANRVVFLISFLIVHC